MLLFAAFARCWHCICVMRFLHCLFFFGNVVELVNQLVSNWLSRAVVVAGNN